MKLIHLKRAFYHRETTAVAKELLGKLLVRKLEGKTLIGKIVEVEAYLGSNDPAAHAFKGMTKRTEVLFGDPGHAYIYTIHGHHCLNVSAEKTGTAGCVLIRSVEPLQGIEVMKKLREKDLSLLHLTNGPGKLCKAFGIDLSLYGIDLTSEKSELRICDHNEDFEIESSKRIGITKAATLPLRFTIKNNAYISR